MIIELPYLPPASFSPNSRVHWAVRGRDNVKVKADVYFLLREQYHTIPSFKAIKLKYTVVVPDRRRRDADNFRAMTKPITDALTLCGIIRDDTPQYIKENSLVFEYIKGRKATVVEIIEVQG